MSYRYNVANENSATKTFRKNDFSQIVRLNELVKDFRNTHHILSVPGDSVDSRMFYDGIQYLQIAYTTDISKREKKTLLIDSISNNDFRKCCNYRYNERLKYMFIRKMINKQCFWGLNIYLTIYGKMKKWTYKAKR